MPSATSRRELTGSCHCGNVAVTLWTSRAPAELVLRACQCSFCRRHNVRSTADPEAELEVRIGDPSRISRYQFGLRLSDFIVCSRCGVYVAAVMADGDRHLATLNANVLDVRDELTQTVEPVTYDGETPESRSARRRGRWTPARVIMSSLREEPRR